MFMATQASRNLLPSQPKPSTGVAQRSGAKPGAKRLISVPTTTPQHEINPLQKPSFLKALSFLTHPAIKFPEYPTLSTRTGPVSSGAFIAFKVSPEVSRRLQAAL